MTMDSAGLPNLGNRFVEVAPGSASIRTEPRGQRPVSKGEARVEVLACGICGTDLHLWRGMRLPPGAEYPVRPGHEVCGRIVELGEPTTAEEVGEEGAEEAPALDDLVVLHPIRPCGTCSSCAAGFDQLCPHGQILGIHQPGGLADEVIWPTDRMVRIEGVNPTHAAVLADAVATAYRAVRVAALSDSPAVCVIGAGGVGTHVLELLRALHSTATVVGVTGTDGSAARLREAGHTAEVTGPDLVKRLRRDFGAFDHVFDFSGARQSPAQGIRLLKTGGTLVFGSVLEGTLDLGPAVALQTRELTVRGVYNSSMSDLREVVALATSGRLDLAHSVSHTADLGDAVKAFTTLADRPSGLVRMVLTTTGSGDD
jgi:2-desacetyl-2-hydroxyethyl bacteriochlorophyllide A dehydrogenase